MKKSLLLICLSLGNFLYAGDSFEVSGQIVADSAWFTDEEGESTNEQAIRRARLSLSGKILPTLKYEVEYSLTGNNNWKDVYLEYEVLPELFLKVGNIKESIGLEALTSSKYNSFMERSLAQALLSKRKLGMKLRYPFKDDDHHYTLTMGAFGKSLDELIDNEEVSKSVVARATYAYIPSKTQLLHLGIATSYSDYDGQSISLNTEPESDLFDRKLVSTKVKDVEQTQRVDIESAIIYNSFAFQGEYLFIGVDSIDTSYNFNSWYLQGSWFITGESKEYKAKKASFSRVKPLNPLTQGGWGAWEVAVRMSQIDIDDKDEEESIETDYTLGINWYATKNLRVMANYIRAELSEPTGTSENIMQIRTQFDF